jgi:outer membrane protein OmpA-like peptidoglycan-associated protein
MISAPKTIYNCLMIFRNIPLAAVVFLAGAVITPAQVLFRYNHSAGDKWHLNVTVDEEVFIDGVSSSRSEILNKIAVEILEGSGNSGTIWNHYDIAEKDIDSGVYKWSGEYEVSYNRNVDGLLSGIPDSSPVPAVRNVPIFPTEALFPGDRWSGEGREVFNLGPTFGIPETLLIDFPVDYRYRGTEVLDGSSFEVLEVVYGYRWTPDPLDPVHLRIISFDWFPIEVEGVFEQVLWWDAGKGRNYAVDGSFTYTYTMSDGSSYTFRGTSAGHAVYADPMDKDALVREIEELDRPDLRAEATDAGVMVSLDDINFFPDQAVMLPGQKDKLEHIAEILSRYPDRDILITGHTAMVNPRNDGQLLSEQRAETVARYFIESGVRPDTQVMTKGMGHTQPIGTIQPRKAVAGTDG